MTYLTLKKDQLTMTSKLNFTNCALRPLLIVVLIAGASNAMASRRAHKDFEYTGKRPLWKELLLSNAAELKALRTMEYKATNTKVTRYQQFYNGWPVENAYVVDTLNEATGQHHVLGSIQRGLASDLSAYTTQITKEKALELAETSASVQDATKITQIKVELNIKPDINKEGPATLGYAVSFIENSQQHKRLSYRVDATSQAVVSTGDLTARLNATGPGGNGNTGKYLYPSTLADGTKLKNLVVTSDCTMKSDDVFVVDRYTDENNETPFKFVDCPDPHSGNTPTNPEQNLNGAFSPINDAYYFGQVVFDMYRDTGYLGLPPIDHILQMNVDVLSLGQSAVWNGTANFGQGSDITYPMVSLDRVAHEVSHGFTEENSKMPLSGEPGGMTEAFSDMAGEAAKFFLHGHNDFHVYSDLFKDGKSASRYMDNPRKNGRGIDNRSNYNPTLDVHDSAGVYSKAFQLLATTKNWDTRKAFQVMAHANLLYWGPDSTFNKGACGVEQSARNLGYAVADVTAAFASVGVSCTDPTTDNTMLANGIPVRGIKMGGGGLDNFRTYSFNVPAGQTNLTFSLTGETNATGNNIGDGDIYMKFGSPPDLNIYDAKSDQYGNSYETITIPNPKAGTYYLMIDNGLYGDLWVSLVANYSK
ncbi:M4 family metallopeptidase [Actimicrobium sp. CCI2.3]|uniref:M4 family metallopeptidase n=1 Tax=Actimicrobium sp. CCI2.3 TaxID=3048616 RepID=UPI002AB50F8C|nr:M4 family metallopeptidase [Actimicrobium sp. CCI2.3]MDY7574086.1 M4 family metallopeptidase [Actimicrobium sp. CCI2.3]MEB0023932.1 M4 family metallopeptidase [Actimicrobium sp. CCI2.3]